MWERVTGMRKNLLGWIKLKIYFNINLNSNISITRVHVIGDLWLCYFLKVFSTFFFAIDQKRKKKLQLGQNQLKQKSTLFFFSYIQTFENFMIELYNRFSIWQQPTYHLLCLLTCQLEQKLPYLRNYWKSSSPMSP